VNVAVEASRRIKNETGLSSGAASVSFAAVQYIKQHLPSLKGIKVLLLGTGDIGQATCGNLLKHLPDVELTLMNRSQEKALALAQKYQLETLPLSQLKDGIAKVDVVVVATGADNPTVTAQHLPSGLGKTLFLDLSVPRNVHQSVEEHPRCQVAHVDQLIDLTREAIERRSEEIPLAEQMLEESAEGFYQWVRKRRFAPVLQALKAELSEIQRREIQTLAKKNPETDPDQLEVLGARMVQKITNRFASYLHQHPGDADQDLTTIQEIFGLSNLSKLA
ncbi:MAG: Gfo/Idh/MocA family oxidoreductase, partial [Bacteroidota bacterium]